MTDNSWLLNFVISEARFNLAVLTDETHLKVPDSGRAMKSEVVSSTAAPTAINWDWRQEALWLD